MFLAPATLPAGRSADDAIETELAGVPSLSTGIMSATQGVYKTAQLLLDVTQGARVSYSAYSPANPPTLSLTPGATQASQAGAGVSGRPQAEAAPRTQTEPRPWGVPDAQVQGWAAARRRAQSAPQLLSPGLLAGSIPGSGAYAGIDGQSSIDGALAADGSGRVAVMSLGPAATLLARIGRLRANHRLVVADLPSDTGGYADLRALAFTRPPGELLIVVQRAPDEPGHELLWAAFAGLPPLRGTGGAGGHTLTSQSTNERGLIAAIDLAPTILAHLGLPVPAAMRGRPVQLDGALDGASLRALEARLTIVDARRLPALEWLVLAWALLLALARLPIGRGDRRRRGAWAMRVGALAMLWTPSAVLVGAALEPSRAVEYAVLVLTCFSLGALTDRLLRWPRAPIVPAVAALLALTVDALAGTQLLMRSLLGPNPAYGARFYGIGNELKSGLAVLVLCGVAAALYPAVRSRRAALAMAAAGIVLAAIEGSARIGAGVGGVILVSAGTAVATVMLLPGTLTRKRLLVVMAAPVAGLVALAALDLATAHGTGHFTGSVLDAHSAGDIRDIIVRRYGAAFDELRNHLMPVATGLTLLASVVAVRRRERICEPVDSDPAWLAALAGGLTAGVIGALSEDSGPVLLVVAVFTLGCVLSYLWGRP